MEQRKNEKKSAKCSNLWRVFRVEVEEVHISAKTIERIRQQLKEKLRETENKVIQMEEK